MTDVLTDTQLKDARIFPKDLGNLVKSIDSLNEVDFVPLEVSEVLHAIGLIGIAEAKDRKLNYGGWVPQEILFEKKGNDNYVAHFLDRNTSLIFQNPQGSYDSFMKASWNIVSDADVVGELDDNDGLLHIRYDKLPFNEMNNNYNTVLLNPHKPARKNTLRGKVQRNYYGKEEDVFRRNMETLIGFNDVARSIYIPSKDSIVAAFDKNPDAKAISRACWLGIFDYGSYVGANFGYVLDDDGLVFGVPSKARSANAKILP